MLVETEGRLGGRLSETIRSYSTRIHARSKRQKNILNSLATLLKREKKHIYTRLRCAQCQLTKDELATTARSASETSYASRSQTTNCVVESLKAG